MYFQICKWIFKINKILKFYLLVQIMDQTKTFSSTVLFLKMKLKLTIKNKKSNIKIIFYKILILSKSLNKKAYTKTITKKVISLRKNFIWIKTFHPLRTNSKSTRTKIQTLFFIVIMIKILQIIKTFFRKKIAFRKYLKILKEKDLYH